MITVVFVKNPFEPQRNREVRTLPYVKGEKVSYYVQQCTKDLTLPDMVISRNSYTINGVQAVKDNDFIVFSPVVGKGHGKNPLLIIATVALSVTAMGVGGMVAAGSFSGAALASATGFAAIGGYLAAAAVMFIGGSLIQRAFGTANISGFKDTTENPTYSWTGITTTNGQNNPIPITYGTVRSGGQTIGKYINSDSDKQYLNWLVCAGYGPLKIYDVQLNDNPIENYKDVNLDTREGLNVQDIIPNFNDTISTKTLSYEILDNEWCTDIVTGTATQGLIIYVECSNGLYYANDKGELDETYVTIEAQYAKEGTSDWKELATNVCITGNKSSAIRKQYRVDNLEAGQYQVRVKVVSRGYPTTSTRACTRIWWTGVSGIVYDDFSYPGIALIGIRAMATDQLSGSPTLKFMKQRSTVYVWNPSTNAYEEKAATNPAWAAYDMVHRANKITDARNGSTVYIHSGADASLMMYNQFSEWAAYCDQFNLKINIEINTSGELLDVVNRYIAPVGRGIVELFGTKYGCVWDGPKEAVQMFGMGNIISGTFSETFLQTSDRANAVEVTFTNAQKDYERDTVKVYGPTFDTDEYDTTSQLTYDGITDYEQAYREAKFQLYCNAYMVRTVSFQAAIDAISCTVGDVIYVAHDVPMWQTSGRIASVSGTTVVVNAVMQSYDSTKTYTFAYRSSVTDTRYEVGCKSITVGDATTTVVLTSVPESAPAAGDIFDIAEVSKGTKKFVVRSISRTEDLVREIEALEYNENVFNENYTIPPINYSDSDVANDVQNVTDLIGRQTLWKDNAGQVHSKMYLSWQYPADRIYQYFSIFVSTDNKNFVSLGTAISKYFEDEVNVDTTYYVKVVTVNQFQKSSGAMITVAPGVVQPATTPTDLTAIEKYAFLSDGTPHYSITITWQPDKLTGQVYYKRTGTQAQNAVLKDGVAAEKTGYSSDWTFAGTGANQLTISPAIAGEYYKIAVCTADELGLYTDADSAPYTEIYVEPKKLIPNTPDNVSLIFDEASHISWDSVTNCDIKYYEIRTDTNAGADDAGLLGRTNRLSTTIPLKSRTGTVCVFACSTDHKYSRPAVLQYNKDMPAAPTIDAQAGIGNLRLQVGAIPAGCLGVNYYINDQLEKTKNTTINHAVKTAGIYDVAAAYYDLFGEGEKSITLHVYVTDKVDQQFLADNAVALKNVDQDIKTAVNNANMAIPRITSLDSEVNGIVNNLNLDPGSCVYKSISDLNKSETELSLTFATVKASQDEVNSSVDTQISQIKQDATSLSSTVQSNKTAQDAQNTSFISQITQNATNISSVVTALSNTNKDLASTKEKVDSNYTAIVQNQNDIALRVKTGELIQQINLSEEGVAINGSKIHITGDTVFDNGIIVSSYIGDSQVVGTKIADGAISTAKLSANSVTANELASNSVTTEKIKAGAITTDRIAAGAITADKLTSGAVTANELASNSVTTDKIKAGAITTDRIAAGAVTAESIGAGAITTDKLTSGAVTADKLAANEIDMAGALKIVGGAVTLDEKGMTVKETSGSSVQFGQSGMSFIDSNGHAFAGIGRFCTGIVNDGQTVKFANPWDITPAVFLFPIRLQTSAVGYTNINMYQDVEAINVSKEGFTAVCKSVLKAGSGASLPLSWTCSCTGGDYTSYRTDTYSYNINIPTTATHIWVSGEITAYCLRYSYTDKNGGTTHYKYPDEGSITISTNTGITQTYTDYVNGGNGRYEYSTNDKTYYIDTSSFTFDMAVSNVSTVTVTFSFYGPCFSSSGGKITSYRTNLDSDVTVCQGTAGFIAIDPNTVPYSVS